MRYRLGLKPVQEQPRVRLRDYLKSDLPSVDDLTFPLGHADAIQPQMFGNDVLGNCAVAGSIEEIRLANALRGVEVNFTTETAIENYSAITGYVPGDPSTDEGTDVHELYNYRKMVGIADADGNRHKILAYAGLTPDFDELLVALSLFDMVGIGIQVPDYCDAQFEAHQPWQVLPGRHQIEGGHYVPVVGAVDRNTALVYTWGAQQELTAPFYAAFNTVAVVALTAELFTNGKDIDGVDMKKLARDLPELNTGVVTAKAPKRE